MTEPPPADQGQVPEPAPEAPANRPLRGVAFKLGSVLVFIVMSAMIKATADHVPGWLGPPCCALVAMGEAGAAPCETTRSSCRSITDSSS